MTLLIPELFGVWKYPFILFVNNIYFQYDIGEWKNIVQKFKSLTLIKLWASVALEIWLVTYCYQQKSACEVTNDVCLVI